MSKNASYFDQPNDSMKTVKVYIISLNIFGSMLLECRIVRDFVYMFIALKETIANGDRRMNIWKQSEKKIENNIKHNDNEILLTV